MPISNTDWHFLWIFSSSSQKTEELFCVFAVMFIVMLAFYFLSHHQPNTRYGLNMKAMLAKMDVFQNRLGEFTRT